MSKIINFEEIKLAKRVVKDFPGAIQKLDICLNMLYDNKEYFDIANVIQQMEESKYLMELTLDVYSQILEGKKNE